MPSARARGLLLLVVSAILFGVMALLAKAASVRGVPGPEVAMVRFAVTIVAVGGYFVARRRAPVVHNAPALLLRGVFGGTAVLGFFLAIAKLPVGVATLLNYTQPIPIAIFAALFLGERLRRATIAALALTMAGVLLIVHARAPLGQLGLGPWELVGVLSSLLSGAAVTAIRWGRRTDGAWEVLASFGVIGFLVCLPPSLAAWVRPDGATLALMLATGLVSVAAQLLYTHALRDVPAATSGIVSQLTPLSALVLGVLLLDDRLTWGAAIGALVTVAGVALGAGATPKGSTRAAVPSVPRRTAG